MDGTGPRKSLNRLAVRVSSHQSLVQSLPEMNLDAYKVRPPHRWGSRELTFTSNSVVSVRPYRPTSTQFHLGSSNIFHGPHFHENDLYLVAYTHIRHESPVDPTVSTVPPSILVVIDALQVAVGSAP